jgi:hypothetical protein
MSKRVVRIPHVDLDARGDIQTHGKQTPFRGVWHSTECGDAHGITELEGVVGFWMEQNLGYGAHVIIDKDGNSALCADPNQITYAVEHHNTNTWSVELIGYARFTPKLWWARVKQLDKLARWMAWLNLEYGVPLQFGVSRGWSRHLDQSKAFGGSHTDPGVFFPYRFVLRKARKYRKNGWM